MARTTPLIFVTLALVLVLGCCHGKTCVPATAPHAGDAAAAPVH